MAGPGEILLMRGIHVERASPEHRARSRPSKCDAALPLSRSSAAFTSALFANARMAFETFFLAVSTLFAMFLNSWMVRSSTSPQRTKHRDGDLHSGSQSRAQGIVRGDFHHRPHVIESVQSVPNIILDSRNRLPQMDVLGPMLCKNDFLRLDRHKRLAELSIEFLFRHRLPSNFLVRNVSLFLCVDELCSRAVKFPFKENKSAIQIMLVLDKLSDFIDNSHWMRILFRSESILSVNL
jgi:hypothetical protein